jgi:hypothetical protein
MNKVCLGVFTFALVVATTAAWSQQPQSPESPAPAPSASPQPAPPSEAKPAETQPAETQPAETKPAEAKPAEAKPAESKSAQSTAPAGAYSYIVNVHNGETVISPFKVVFGLTSNMGVAPAGVEKPNVGHHHLLIDTTLTAEQLTQPIPADQHHLHFGKGQTETAVTLPPGKHTLQLVLGDWSHVPFNPSVQSAVVTVNVKGPASAKAPAKIKGASLARRRHHRL